MTFSPRYDNKAIPLMPLPREQFRYDDTKADSERVSYLLLRIGIPPQLSSLGSPHVRGQRGEFEVSWPHLCRINRSLEPIGVTVEPLNLRSGATRSLRYLFSFPDHQCRDADAQRLAEAFACGLGIADDPIVLPDTSMAFRLPRGLTRCRTIGMGQLVEIEASCLVDGQFLNPSGIDLFAARSSDENSHELAWRIAVKTFDQNALFEATRFLQRSFECLWPGDVEDIASCDISPQGVSVRSRYEDALHNAFKAIESIIGDPPRDDRRLSEKLKKVGICEDEPVGYLVKQPVKAAIRSMSTARDKKSAHGGTRERHIKTSELIDFQECARFVVVAALEAAGVVFQLA